MTYNTDEERLAAKKRSQRKYYNRITKVSNATKKLKTEEEKKLTRRKSLHSYYWNVLKPRNDAAKLESGWCPSNRGRRPGRNIDKGKRLKTLQVKTGTFVVSFD